MNVETGIILAAGRGTRLGSLAQGRPKCLVHTGGRTLLEQQLSALLAVGVRRVAIVVGYQEHLVRAACEPFERRAELHFVRNIRYAETNTIYSQYLARAFLDDGAYCMNGDVLFAGAVLERLRAHRGGAALAVEAKRCGDEEVKVVVDDARRIVSIGKELDPRRCLGEFVGVARYDAAAGGAFARSLVEEVEVGRRERDYFEWALARIADRTPLDAVVLEGEPVIEIDTPADLERACTHVVPRLAPLAKPPSRHPQGDQE